MTTSRESTSSDAVGSIERHAVPAAQHHLTGQVSATVSDKGVKA